MLATVRAFPYDIHVETFVLDTEPAVMGEWPLTETEQDVKRIILVLIVSVSMVLAPWQTTNAVQSPGNPGGATNYGVFSHTGYSNCNTGFICITPYTTNTCLTGSTYVCHVYNMNGNSSQWAGYTDYAGTDKFGASVTVGTGARAMRNRQATTGRDACAYSGFYETGGGYFWTVPYSFSGFSTIPWTGGGTGVRSVAAVPNTSSWDCNQP